MLPYPLYLHFVTRQFVQTMFVTLCPQIKWFSKKIPELIQVWVDGFEFIVPVKTW